MTDNTERANFEAWMKTRLGHPFAGKFANLMWAAWQARAALSAATDAPVPKFEQAEFEEMVRRGTVAWAGVDTKNIYGDGDAQREQDRMDAERYRWLRDVGDSTYTAFANHPGYDAMQADRHIDAAIAQAKEGT